MKIKLYYCTKENPSNICGYTYATNEGMWYSINRTQKNRISKKTGESDLKHIMFSISVNAPTVPDGILYLSIPTHVTVIN